MKCYCVGLVVGLMVNSAASSCDLNSTAPISAVVASVHDSQEPRQVLISNNVQLAIPNAPGVIAMHDAHNLDLLGKITAWPTELGTVAAITAEPVILDANYDGKADAVYAVDRSGLLWFSAVADTGFSAPVLVADFRALNAEFSQPLRIVQFTAPPYFGHQVLLLLIASTSDGADMLIAVKHQPNQLQAIDLDALTDRSDISADEQQYGISEQLWQQLQQGAGWYIQLEQKVTVLPQVYAGVIYFAAADSSMVNADCSVKDASSQNLYALHLHHAGLVYTKRNWQVNSTAKTSLALITNTQGELELVLQNGQQQQGVLSDLLAISDECADCVSPLSAGQFPRLIRLATFQAEQGAH